MSENARAPSSALFPFSDPESVRRYAETPMQLVPGFHALQTMTRLLLAERAPNDARVLVLGAGGGLELKVFAENHPAWTFCGVDPSAEMLALAKRTLGPLASRVDFHEGYIDTAPTGLFDAATCLLTFHFLPEAERRRTLSEIHRRLKPGTPFVVAHFSFPQADAEKTTWLSRYAAFATASGVPAENLKNATAAIREQLSILSPTGDETLLREAGFTDISLFYTAFTFRGWVCYKT